MLIKKQPSIFPIGGWKPISTVYNTDTVTVFFCTYWYMIKSGVYSWTKKVPKIIKEIDLVKQHKRATLKTYYLHEQIYVLYLSHLLYAALVVPIITCFHQGKKSLKKKAVLLVELARGSYQPGKKQITKTIRDAFFGLLVLYLSSYFLLWQSTTYLLLRVCTMYFLLPMLSISFSLVSYFLSFLLLLLLLLLHTHFQFQFWGC